MKGLTVQFRTYRLPIPVDLLDRHVSHDGPLVTLKRLLRHEDYLVRVLPQDFLLNSEYKVNRIK